jgi:phospholipase C
MRFVQLVRTGLLLTLVMGWTAAKPARGDGELKKVKHVVVIMQENHSFDNYFGALAYAPVVRTTAGCSVAARKIMIALTG